MLFCDGKWKNLFIGLHGERKLFISLRFAIISAAVECYFHNHLLLSGRKSGSKGQWRRIMENLGVDNLEKILKEEEILKKKGYKAFEI